MGRKSIDFGPTFDDPMSANSSLKIKIKLLSCGFCVFNPQNSQICTIFSKISWVGPPDPHNWEGGKPLPQTPSTRVYRPTFSELPECWVLIVDHVVRVQGYRPTVFYPKPSTRHAVYATLATQCEKADIPSLLYLPSDAQLVADSHSLVVDAIFGVGYEPPMTSDFAAIVQTIIRSKVPVVSIDVPSGRLACLAINQSINQSIKTAYIAPCYVANEAHIARTWLRF